MADFSASITTLLRSYLGRLQNGTALPEDRDLLATAVNQAYGVPGQLMLQELFLDDNALIRHLLLSEEASLFHVYGEGRVKWSYQGRLYSTFELTPAGIDAQLLERQARDRYFQNQKALAARCG